MRTVLASSLAIVSSMPAWAHEGHGESGFHWHGGDLLSVGAAALAVVLWVWQRNKR